MAGCRPPRVRSLIPAYKDELTGMRHPSAQLQDFSILRLGKITLASITPGIRSMKLVSGSPVAASAPSYRLLTGRKLERSGRNPDTARFARWTPPPAGASGNTA